MKLSILTGPTFADEIANNQPAAAVIANKVIEQANSICELFHHVIELNLLILILD